VIASNGFVCHSPAVDGMVGEEENEIDGFAEADNVLSAQTKKKRNNKRLREHKRVLFFDCKLRKLSKVGGSLSGLEFE
jgi:hypothetical protein